MRPKTKEQQNREREDLDRILFEVFKADPKNQGLDLPQTYEEYINKFAGQGPGFMAFGNYLFKIKEIKAYKSKIDMNTFSRGKCLPTRRCVIDINLEAPRELIIYGIERLLEGIQGKVPKPRRDLEEIKKDIECYRRRQKGEKYRDIGLTVFRDYKDANPVRRKAERAVKTVEKWIKKMSG